MVNDSISISWELVYKISLSWVDMLIFYVLLFGVVYLAWCDFVMDSTKEFTSHFVQLWEKVWQRPWQWLDKCLGKLPWAIHGYLNGTFKRTETERGGQVKSKVKSMHIILFNIKGVVHKEFSLAGRIYFLRSIAKYRSEGTLVDFRWDIYPWILFNAVQLEWEFRQWPACF
jgi:hypothetical protein